MADGLLGTFLNAAVSSILTGALWDALYQLNPIANLILILWDVVSWAGFVLSILA